MFAMKFCRQLSKRAAAMHIGADGCWLLTVIAMQEDASHYEVAPQYYDIQLADRCGWHRTKVDRVRQKCIEAGYLHYEPGPHRGTSTYWVILPSRSLPDDEPTSRGATQDATQSATSTAPQMHANCTPTAHEMRTARDIYIPDPVPVPDPVPKNPGAGFQEVNWWGKLSERDLRDDSRVDVLLGAAVAGGFAQDTDEERVRFAALIVHVRRKKSKKPFGLFQRIIEGRANSQFDKNKDWRTRATDADHDRARAILHRVDGVGVAQAVSKAAAESDATQEQQERLAASKKALQAAYPTTNGKAAS